ncbi:hypothetical protein X735_31485 [Mesorhizobium sp. L2C085B000]|nr:hypothetical protein X735_31485 [Mesorhizobium sp. L2C085B000]
MQETWRARSQTDDRCQLEMQLPEIGAKSSSSALIGRTFVALINIRREISNSSWPDAAAGDGAKGAVAISSPAAPTSRQSAIVLFILSRKSDIAALAM